MEEYTKEKLEYFMKKNAPINFKMYLNIVIALIVLAYFILINLVNQDTYSVNNIIKVFTILFLISTITIFEIAYKKDDDIIAINGLETLVITIHSLLINHIISKSGFSFENYTLISALVITSYYVIKTLIMYTRDRKKYLDSLSDISEIVRKEQPIKKEAKKRRNSENENKPDNSKLLKKVIVQGLNNDLEKKVSKRSSDTNDIKKHNSKISSSKKRGRPKKEVL